MSRGYDTIWKKILTTDRVQSVEVPHNSRILCAREQHECICIWYACSPELPVETRVLYVIPTGSPTDEADNYYLGTAMLIHGGLVFHVFEKRPDGYSEGAAM